MEVEADNQDGALADERLRALHAGSHTRNRPKRSHDGRKDDAVRL